MLKFIKGHMETIGGIEIFPLISFLIFFIFFTLLTIWIIRTDKKRLHQISQIPLDQNDGEPHETNNQK